MQNNTITELQYQAAATILKCEVEALKAVDLVESSGDGFLPNGKLKILFEGHKFYEHTQGKFKLSDPDLCYLKYTNKYYNLDQWKRYQEAAKLDAVAAALSCSWGRFQIMGDEYWRCGYQSVIAMIDDFKTNEYRHLLAAVNFMINKKIDDDLRLLNWAMFSYYWNGPKYYLNKHDLKLAKAYSDFKKAAKKS